MSDDEARQRSSAVVVVAGAGALPVEAVECLRREGRAVSVIAFEGITDADFGNVSSEVTWLRFGQLEPLAQALEAHANAAVLLLGKFGKSHLGSGRPQEIDPSATPAFAPDATVSAILTEAPDRHDDRLISLVVDWFESRGIVLLDQAQTLPGLVISEEVLTRAQPSRAALADLEAGIEVLRDRATCGDAQCVVMRGARLLAIEDDKGTDAAIRRAGASDASGASGSTVVKLTRPGQDRRIDLPTCGPETIVQLAAVGATHLALEAGASLVVSRQAVVEAANEHGIAIWGVRSPWEGA